MTSFTSLQMCALAVGAALFCAVARAETALEREILQAPAPHVLAGAGNEAVTVHFATLAGHLEGEPSNQARLEQLHEAVNRCVADQRRLGQAVDPPREWPRHLNGMRRDFYVTERYAITYYRTWIYGGLNPDCSHFTKNWSANAVLKSTAGICKIDLLRKTANGRCSMEAHRAARVRHAPSHLEGATQRVAGIPCQIRNEPLGTFCIAVGGRMAPAYPLVLGDESEKGFQFKALEAALDIPVSATIFVPHLAGGFSIQEGNK